jgi:hypothetical protein
MDFTVHDRGEPEDLPLKVALKRTLGRETAPPALRDRVMLAMAAAGAFEPVAPKLARPSTGNVLTRPITPKVAAITAGALIVIVSGLWWTIDRMNRPDPGPSIAWQTVPQHLPGDLARALASAHQEALARSRQAPISDANIDSLLPAAEKTVGVKPWTGDLRSEGWKLVDARTMQIAQSGAAQLTYEKEGAVLSVISMPAPLVCTPGSIAVYQDQIEGGPTIVGFTSGNALHCLVGAAGRDGRPISLNEMVELRDRVRRTQGWPACGIPH